MIASDLLDARVLDDDGTPVGWVVDLRFVLDGPPDGPLARARLHGIVVCPRTRTSFLGYERSDVRHPWPIAPLVRWWHRGVFLAHWPDVARAPGSDDQDDPGMDPVVVLRPGYTRYSAAL